MVKIYGKGLGEGELINAQMPYHIVFCYTPTLTHWEKTGPPFDHSICVEWVSTKIAGHI